MDRSKLPLEGPEKKGTSLHDVCIILGKDLKDGAEKRTNLQNAARSPMKMGERRFINSKCGT